MITSTSKPILTTSLGLLFSMNKHLLRLLSYALMPTDFHTFCLNHFILHKKLWIWMTIPFQLR